VARDRTARPTGDGDGIQGQHLPADAVCYGGGRSGVQEHLERPAARVLGEEGRAFGDAEPLLADGAVAEDGFGRQADEDLLHETLVEMKVVAHLLDLIH
jgi:hypothetical protein